MNNEITATVGQQGDALALAYWLSKNHPSLPVPYMTVHSYYTTSLGVQVSYAQFEAWREALGLAAEDVRLHSTATSAWLLADGVVQDVRVQLSGMGLPLLEERPTDELVSAVAA